VHALSLIIDLVFLQDCNKSEWSVEECKYK
jgi:hypothetical protein